MRADAVRRRAALVAAARRLFAERGTDIALEAIAAEAGVGIATLYRNFESRAHLVEHVCLAILEEIAAAATRAESTLSDAGREQEAWLTLIDDLVALDLGALTQAIELDEATGIASGVAAAQREVVAGLDALLARFAEAGVVRPGLGGAEFVVALAVATRPQPSAISRALPGITAKIVAMLVEGMRPDGARG